MNSAANTTATETKAPKTDIAAELAYERNDERIWAEIIEAGRGRFEDESDDE